MDIPTLRVRGMHCAACVALITMELDDAGLLAEESSVALAGNNEGILTLKSDDAAARDRVQAVINALDGYTVHT